MNHYEFTFSNSVRHVPLLINTPLLLNIDSTPTYNEWKYRFGTASLISTKDFDCDLVINITIITNIDIEYVECAVCVDDSTYVFLLKARRIIQDVSQGEGRGERRGATLRHIFHSKAELNGLGLRKNSTLSFSLVRYTDPIRDEMDDRKIMSDEYVTDEDIPGVVKSKFAVLIVY